MSKILFEDDDGKQHEIKLESVSKKSLKKDDVVVAYLEMGGTPPDYVNKALENLKRILEGVFECRVVAGVMRGGKKDVELSIVNKKE